MEANDKKLFIKMVISAWDAQNASITKLLGNLSDEQLLAETAPGRNRGIYIIGHLTAVSDGMMKLLGFDRLYPKLDAVFIHAPDRAASEMPSPSEVKEYWSRVNEKITLHTSQMRPDDWFAKHSAVSTEDFAKEPHRNKLNVLINRTNHHSYHLGQLIYLEKKSAE